MKITWLDNHRYNIPEDTAFMINELDEKQAEIDRLTLALRDREAALSDPVAVHINMLRGVIAKPTLAQIIHLYGEDAIRSALETPTASAAENTDDR